MKSEPDPIHKKLDALTERVAELEKAMRQVCVHIHGFDGFMKTTTEAVETLTDIVLSGMKE